MDQRGPDGRFRVGISGNPGGRPRLVGAVRDLAGAYLVDALRALGEIVRQPELHPSGVVVLAARELLDRAIGRPGFTGPADNDGVRLIDLKSMTDQELAEAIERARLDAGEDAESLALLESDQG